ncbi:MAG: MBOAT family O-acyltransferase [Candidatus Omnitrophota bacterium]
MAFDSYKYLIFLPLVFGIFYFSPDRFRWQILLLASLLFYAFVQAPYLILVLLAVIAVTYFCGILIEKSKVPSRRRLLFWAGILANVLILGYLKYVPFLVDNLNLLFRFLSLDISLAQRPGLVFVGVSFYVFQAISYLADVYLETAKAERHPGYFAVYIGFFPKLLLGPIERCGDLIHQFRKKYEFNYDNMRVGLLMCGWGLFKKLVIADQLRIYIDSVYGNVYACTGPLLIIATYFYAIQIYADFSGYTDIAIGSAKIFNINLTRNFNAPYLATSIADFWRRWHVTFYRWLLDYIFRPLQMEFRTMRNWGTLLALFITLLVSGIWHGAEWHFIAWGILFGLYLGAAVFYKPLQKKIYLKLGLEKTGIQKIWQTLVTFNMVCLAWIFFRAESCKEAFYVITHLHTGVRQLLTGAMSNITMFHNLKHLLLPITLNDPVMFLGYLAAAAIIVFEHVICRKYGDFSGWILGKSKLFRWLAYITLVLAIVNFGKTSEVPFVYFSF